MSDLATRVKRLSKRLLPFALAATTALSGCGLVKKVFDPEENQPPETVVKNVGFNPSTGELEFYAIGLDKEDEITGKVEFMVTNPESSYSSNWITSYTPWNSINLKENNINLQDGDYILVARAVDSKDKVDPTPARESFKIKKEEFKNQPPSVPQLVSPQNGATDISSEAFLEWGESIDPEGDPINYRICFGIDYWDNCNTTTQNTTYTIRDLPSIEPGKFVRWSISASDDKGNYSEGSKIWRFLIPTENNPPEFLPFGGEKVGDYEIENFEQFTIDEGETLEFRVRAADLDGDKLSYYYITGLPEGADFKNQTFSWTPNSNQGGERHLVFFEVSDGINKDGKRVRINVNDISDVDLITEPIEVLPDNTRIFQGTTNSQGLVSFIDETSEDGKAEVRVVDSSNQPVEGMEILYEDMPNSKVLTAIDTTGQFLPVRNYSSHNSTRELLTATVRRGIVHTQRIQEEDGFKAFYLWERNPELAANPYSRYTYERTINEEEVIRKRDFNSRIITLLDYAEKASGEDAIKDAILDIFGISVDVSVADLAREIDPYRERGVEAKRWDVYSTSTGIKLKKPDETFLEREIVGDVLIVPSNPPSASIASHEALPKGLNFMWEAFDDTVYKFPFELPGKRDLTVWSGKTEHHDLTYLSNIVNNTTGEKISQRTSELSIPRGKVERIAGHLDLSVGDYTFFIEVTDEAGNTTNSDTLEFRIEREIQPPKSPEPIPEHETSNKIAFVSRDYKNKSDQASLYLMDPDGSHQERLTEYKDYTYPKWSPDGSKIAFITMGRYSYLQIMDMIARTYIFPHSIKVEDFNWSPDGSKIAYTSEDRKKVSITTLDGIVRDLRDGLTGISGPDWSTSNRLVFSSFINKGADLFSINPDNNEETNLTRDSEGFYFEPEWSPDGTRIAYMHQIEGGGYGIGVMDSNGDNSRMLTDNVYSWYPYTVIKWSPDGTRIAHIGDLSGSDEDSNLYLIDLVKGEERNITQDLGEDYGYVNTFSWSPNGREIAFSVIDGEIFIMDYDGSNKRNITNSPEYEIFPEWSPR